MKIKNMHIIKYSVFSLVTVLLASQAIYAHALTGGIDVMIDGNGDGSGVKASVQTTATASTSSDSLINVKVEGNVSADADMSVTSKPSPIITSNESKVVVSYKRPAKFLGFIPVHITERATIHARSGDVPSVEVRKSWWSFLTVSDTHSEKFSSEIKSRITNGSSLSADGEISASAKDKYVADIYAAAEATYGN